MSFSNSRPAVSRQATVFVVLMMTTALACGRGRGRDTERAAANATDRCTPTEGTLPADVIVEGWEGAYRLSLVRTGDEDQFVQGTLRLRPQVDSLRAILTIAGTIDTVSTIPLIGVASIDVESVGALRLGDLMSDDPIRPGVALVHGPGQIVLRLGSDANLREMPRFDGGYLSLFVRAADSAGFRGIWASGVVTQTASGWFCASRRG